MILLFTTETSNLWNPSLDDYDIKQPVMLKLSYKIINDSNLHILKKRDLYVSIPDGLFLSPQIVKIHGITRGVLKDKGDHLNQVLHTFISDCVESNITTIVSHSLDFHMKVLKNSLYHNGKYDYFMKDYDSFCLSENLNHITKIPSSTDDYKFPSLSEVYHHLFKKDISKDKIDALYDILKEIC